MKNNVTLQRYDKDTLNEREIQQILMYINRDGDFNSQSYKSKKVVSFYDDDLNCLFILRIPFTGDFDIKMLDLCDILEGSCGITNCKYDGEFLQ